MLQLLSIAYMIASQITEKALKMAKAIKKPLLVNFTELEREYIKEKSQNEGVTQGAYIRGLIVKLLVKEGFDTKAQA